MHIINLLQPEEILNISTIEKSDIVSDVFIGNILSRNQHQSVYLKAYDVHTIGDRGLLNEIIGYLLCNLYHIPQPNEAFIALVHQRSITHLLHKTSEKLKIHLKKQHIIPMFCTTKLHGKSLATTFFHSTAIMEQQLIQWQYYKSSIICDEIMANTDRLPRNIITFNKKEFWLIDNGRLVTEEGTNWKIQQLKNDNHYTNYLADLTKNTIQSDPRKGNAIIETAHHIQKNIKNIMQEAQYWINIFAHDNDKKDWQNFLQFISYRNSNIAQLLINRYGMLI